jgi:homoserine trans-succinylase
MKNILRLLHLSTTRVNENARLICDTKKGIDHIYGREVYTCHAKVEGKFKHETMHYYK